MAFGHIVFFSGLRTVSQNHVSKRKNMAGQEGFLGRELEFSSREPSTIPRDRGDPDIYKLRACCYT